jgi:polysaccharide pyruvyl transferase WcaK-like protein
LQEAFEQTLARVADAMIDDCGARIVFLAMSPAQRGRSCVAQDDDIVASSVMKRMRHVADTRLIDPKTPASVIKGMLGRVGLVVSMRMHATILAAEEGTPAVGLAISPKIKAFFSRLGREGMVIDVEDLAHGAEQILSLVQRAWERRKVDKAALIEAVRQLEATERKNAQFLADLLKST